MTQPAPPLAGRYRLHQALDPTGAAWQAADELLHRPVTVRKVPAEALDAVRAATALRHRGVVTVHDVLTDDGQAWAVTEPADGRTLLTAGLLTQADAVALGLDLLDALAHAHALGIVHGAVEPARIVGCADGRFALTGFGAPHTSPAHTPPDPDRTPATDLWAWAAALYAAVEGRPPFASPEALRHGHPLAAVRAPRLAAVLLPALHPDPSARPDAPTLAAALRRLAPRSGPRRVHPALLAIGAVALVAVTVPAAHALTAPDATPNPGQSAAPVLAQMPDVCALLSGERLEQLVPGADEPVGYQDGACTWRTSFRAGDMPGTLTFSLEVKVELSDDPRGALARARQSAGFGGGRVRDLDGLGDDAFVQETTRDSAGSGARTSVEVGFRQANAVVTLELTRSGGAVSAFTDAAVRGAHWTAEELRHG
ncbi:hypothetical protein [Actinocorallia sp. A-T 12471]|uniref:hypothetical protein n=1 Tax=Actinocorallia sp. A-T 12471 TaxID=3089813 RepID=UPI0029CF0DB5|nr:hypothetical protein [Actinocorallia sp. A-T 12471]MDX6743920.1 hypothetical protein [Actinocorallia sp. A-T 12471]